MQSSASFLVLTLSPSLQSSSNCFEAPQGAMWKFSHERHVEASCKVTHPLTSPDLGTMNLCCSPSHLEISSDSSIPEPIPPLHSWILSISGFLVFRFCHSSFQCACVCVCVGNACAHVCACCINILRIKLWAGNLLQSLLSLATEALW